MYGITVRDVITMAAYFFALQPFPATQVKVWTGYTIDLLLIHL